MEREGAGVIELELKYCERCGGLWLRVRGKNEIYCSLCALQLSSGGQKPALEAWKPKWRLRRGRKPPSVVRMPEMPQAGGNAK